MSTIELLLLLLLFLLGAVGSAFFSGTETGLYVLNRVRLKLRVDGGDPAAIMVQNELDHSSRLLVNLLIGNNMMNQLASFAVASLFAALQVGAWLEVAITAVVLTPVLFVFGETLPKELCRANSDRWTYKSIGVLRWVRLLYTVTLLAPIVMLLSQQLMRLFGQDQSGLLEQRQEAKRREVAVLLKEGAGAGILSERQISLLDRALSLRSLTVAAEMVPWSQVVAVSSEADTDSVAHQVAASQYTRLPALDSDGRVLGLVNVLDVFLNPGAPVGQLLEVTAHIEPTTTVREALHLLAQRRAAMAVIEEQGKPIGIVTVKDLVEPLIGELAAW
jgi:magnesium and cobalt exporter, CNNM family